MPLILSLAFALMGCNRDEEVTYTQYNHEEDSLAVEVGVAELLASVDIDLHSSSGEVVIGSASVDPGGGPIGTEHEVVVIISDDYQDDVDRVSARLSSPNRSEDEFELDQDSADEGYYKTILQSVGDDGEVRTDTVTVRVWEAIPDEDDTESTTEGT